MEHEINVKDLRKTLGVTQVQLADAVGVDQSTVSNWETGQNTPRGPAKRLLLSLKAEDFEKLDTDASEAAE